MDKCHAGRQALCIPNYEPELALPFGIAAPRKVSTKLSQSTTRVARWRVHFRIALSCGCGASAHADRP